MLKPNPPSSHQPLALHSNSKDESTSKAKNSALSLLKRSKVMERHSTDSLLSNLFMQDLKKGMKFGVNG